MFEGSLLQVMTAFETRIVQCELDLDKAASKVTKMQSPLVHVRDQGGHEFGEEWMDWAWVGLKRLKESVRELDGFGKVKVQ